MTPATGTPETLAISPPATSTPGDELAGDRWVAIGSATAWIPWTGRAALVAGRQVAVFRLGVGADFVAIDNRDPFSEADVLARGIVGNTGDAIHVASPIKKQRFDLDTGCCLDDPEVTVAVHEVAVVHGLVHLRLAT